jgi:hypothetical protein
LYDGNYAGIDQSGQNRQHDPIRIAQRVVQNRMSRRQQHESPQQMDPVKPSEHDASPFAVHYATIMRQKIGQYSQAAGRGSVACNYWKIGLFVRRKRVYNINRHKPIIEARLY